MSGSVAFEVALGLVFTFLVFSSICSGLNEVVARILNSRGSALFKTVNALIGDVELAQTFWRHPVVLGLMQSRSKAKPGDLGHGLGATVSGSVATTKRIQKDVRRSLPSYMSSSTFATAILDLTNGSQESQPPAPPPVGVRSVVATMADAVSDGPGTAAAPAGAQLQAELEKWFNDSMDRLSGWYKRWVKRILLVLAVAVTIGFNVNTIHISEDLYRQPALRAAVAEQASTATQSPTKGATARPPALPRDLKDAEFLPLGWGPTNRPHGSAQWVWMVLGWLITIAAVSLGAPFWFDLLTRMNSLRSTGPPPAS